MKNGPARLRQQGRSASSYARVGKVPSLYPSGNWGPVSREVKIELARAKLAAFGHNYREESEESEVLEG